MNVILTEDFHKVDDPVKTEEIINSQLLLHAKNFNNDYHYVSLPLAWNINHNGIPYTQRRIDEICHSHLEKKLFFVCQHILVNQLNFHGNLVFTPHATIFDSFMPLPHYSCTYDVAKIKPWSEREYNFSFAGSFSTHPVRKKLYDALSQRKDCLIVDTGSWHFEGDIEKQKQNADTYIEILGNTKYSLCPRGTGPSTIRIWECMAMGSKPIIISDFLKMPLDMKVSVDLWSKIPENFDIEMFDNILENESEYDNNDYVDIFANDKLYKTVVRSLEGW